jgi:translation initiation factor 1
MAKKRRTIVEPAAPQALSSLGDLLRQRGVEVVPDSPEASVPQPRQTLENAEPDLSRSGRIVVRRERKGHGGKTITVVDGLKLSTPHLEMLARQMRRALGCGAWVDDGRVNLQGDLARGAEAWLRGRGARQVTQGN